MFSKKLTTLQHKQNKKYKKLLEKKNKKKIEKKEIKLLLKIKKNNYILTYIWIVVVAQIF